MGGSEQLARNTALGRLKALFRLMVLLSLKWRHITSDWQSVTLLLLLFALLLLVVMAVAMLMMMPGLNLLLRHLISMGLKLSKRSST